MADREMYLWGRFDAHQVALALGLFQTILTAFVYLGVGSVVYFLLDHKPDLFESVDVDFLMTMFTIGYFIVTLVFHVSLTVGALKGVRWLMVPWLAVAWLSVPFTTIAAAVDLFDLRLGSARQVYSVVFNLLHTTVACYGAIIVTKSFRLLGRTRAEGGVSYHRGQSSPPPLDPESKT